MIRRSVNLLVLLAGLALSSAQTPRPLSDWPQWRGPRRDGSIAAQLPAEWPAALKKRWEAVAGAGHSSPVVAGNRVVVFARQNDREVTRALDLATGREIWRDEYAAPYTVNPAARAHGPGPKSTPAVAGGRVFTFGIGGVLSALDLATGKPLWRTKPPAVLPEYGTAASPLVDGGVVIAHMGGRDGGAMTAFDAATGTVRWRWDGDGPGYGSPIIATLGKVRQLVAQTQKLLVGLNSGSGKLLWSVPFTTSYNQNSITPVAFGELVINSGLEKPVTAFRIRNSGSAWTAEPAWTVDQTSLYMSSAVVIGSTLYGLSHRNRGQLFALDPSSGKQLWTTEGRAGDNASLMGNRSWLLVSTTDGDLIVARPGTSKFDEVRRYQVSDSALWAHPAVAQQSIVVKGVEKVICWSW
ncbi:MAG TPA: PQQ-binding-like beta-propeller repeat protein [Vicinamibacterales bacterium]